MSGGTLAPAPPLPTPDYRLDDLRLDVSGSKGLDVTVGDSITAATLDLTIEGASTVRITVEDPHGRLMRSDVLSRWAWGREDPGDEEAWVQRGQPVDISLDHHDFRLVKVSKTGTSLALTFEDVDVTYMRRHRGARKANRSKVTRAEFVALLVRAVFGGGGVELYCPELHKRQPIGKATQRVSARRRRDDGHPGIPSKARLTVKGLTATPAQKKIAERALDVARSRHAPKLAVLALLCALIIESEMKNVRGGEGTSYGVLQATSIHGSIDHRMDVEAMCAQFLGPGFAGAGGAIHLARQHPTWSPGRIAQTVQASAYPDRYDVVLPEARRFYAAYHGGRGREGDTDTLTGVRWKPYIFARGRNENTWDAIGRLAEEVGWRRFMRLGRLWFISEEDLFQQRPELEMREGEDGCDWLDFDVDVFARIPVAEVRAQVRAARWTALPGMVASVAGAGPADGRWLVSSVTRNLLDSSGAAEVTLRKPIPELPEPHRESETIDSGGTSGGLEGAFPSGTRSKVERAYNAALRISAKDMPYVWGGGHARAGHPDGGTGKDPGIGYDCSGYVSACLKAADMLPSGVLSSGLFASSWGSPGRGKHMTVWANAGHVWIEFNVPGKRGKRADTSPHDNGPNGPHMRYTERSASGFVPRHWPGT